VGDRLVGCLIGVRFKQIEKIYYFFSEDSSIAVLDLVICKRFGSVECGRVVVVKANFNKEGSLKDSENAILRKASIKDIEKLEKIKSKQKWVHSVSKDKILEHKLDMKLIDTYYFFDTSKIILYFTSNKRIDFRNLVRDLAKIFKTRTELIQIGVRDEAKILGGIGVCGIPVCCATFLDDFRAVSIKMAKHQGIFLNPSKISGTCGRLMCCLRYEEESYSESH
jgi:cell fate regulator YaaT (PSP1 superfamily)